MKKIIISVLVALIIFPLFVYLARDALYNCVTTHHTVTAVVFYVIGAVFSLVNVTWSIEELRFKKKEAEWRKEFDEQQREQDRKMADYRKAWEGTKKIFEQSDNVVKAFQSAISGSLLIDARFSSFKDTAGKELDNLNETTRWFLETEVNEAVSGYNSLIEKFPDLKVDFKRYFLNELCRDMSFVLPRSPEYPMGVNHGN